MIHTLYTTFELDNTPYILPYGQAIADHHIGIATNSVGILLWKALTKGATGKDLVSLLAKMYQSTEDDIFILQKDVEAFMSHLEINGIYKNKIPVESCYSPVTVKIGTLVLSLHAPDALIKTYFSDFVCEKTDCDQALLILPYAPFDHINGTVLVRTDEMLIMDTEDAYVYLPFCSRYIHELHVSKDAKTAHLYANMREVSPECLDELFHMLRFAFLALAQEKDLLVLHSASVLHNGKAWLFSGHSGVGKSTHANLWVQEFGSTVLNGDLNLLGIEDAQAVCYGLPWCGSSETYTTDAYPLGGVTFLHQAPENTVKRMASDVELLQLAQRCINPSFTKEQVQKNISMAEKLCRYITCFELGCTPDPTAAYTMRDAINAL